MHGGVNTLSDGRNTARAPERQVRQGLKTLHTKGELPGPDRQSRRGHAPPLIRTPIEWAAKPIQSERSEQERNGFRTWSRQGR